MKSLFLIVLSATLFVSCKKAVYKEVEFETVLESSTGEGYTLAKRAAGYRVYKNDVTGEFVAYNMDKFDPKTMKTLDSYLAQAGEKDIVNNLEVRSEWVEEGYFEEISSSYTTCDADNNCTTSYTSYTGNWIDTSRYVAFYYGGGFRFENATTQSHDLETLAAQEEGLAVGVIKTTLAATYSLSSHRAEELAELAYRYKKMESVRELTAGEKNVFALNALGVSLSQIEKTLKEKALGDEASYRDLLEKAAAVNRTTPEQIGKFFEDYITE